MRYLLHKDYLKEELLNQLSEDIKQHKQACFTTFMNLVFIESLEIIQEDLFFKFIEDLYIGNGFYTLNEQKIEDAYKQILELVKQKYDEKKEVSYERISA